LQHYKPWELTAAQEDQIKDQVDAANAVIDQELEDFDRRREGEEGFVRPNRVDTDIIPDAPERSVGAASSGDLQEDPSTINGTTDHSAATSVHDDAKNDNREKAREETAAKGDCTAQNDDQKIDPKASATDDTSGETMDETGEVVVEATEDTVIY
jgi:hypothetical protein